MRKRAAHRNMRGSRSPPAQGARHVVDLTTLDDDALAAHLALYPLEAEPLPTIANTSRNYTVQASELSYDIYAAQVLEVFPDVSIEHLKLLWSERVPPNPSEQSGYKQDELAHAVILQLSEKSGYPKERRKGASPKRNRSASESSEDENTDWKDARLKFEYDSDYIREMTLTLLNEFPFASSDHIKRVTKIQRFLYESFLAMVQANNKEPKDGGYESLKNARKPRASFLVTPKEVGDILQAEVVAARRKASKQEARRQKIQEKAAAKLAERISAEETGAITQCQCCFDENVPLIQVVHCEGDEHHAYCEECALSYAKTQIGQGKYAIVCFGTQHCKAGFSHADKLRFLDSDMLKLLDKLEQNDIMRMAEMDGLEGLAKCPFCDYAEIYPDVSEDKIFRCKASACLKESCRICNHESHIPKTCAEYKAENGMTERHRIEEARTAALLRPCPKCKTPIVKDDGCNKMICSKCKCAICDYCGKDITKEGYSHFAADSIGIGPKCPTHDDTRERNEERIKVAEMKALAKIRAENPGLSEEDLKIKFSEKVDNKPDVQRGRHWHGHHWHHHQFERGVRDFRVFADALGQFRPANPMEPPINPVEPALRRARDNVIAPHPNLYGPPPDYGAGGRNIHNPFNIPGRRVRDAEQDALARPEFNADRHPLPIRRPEIERNWEEMTPEMENAERRPTRRSLPDRDARSVRYQTAELAAGRRIDHQPVPGAKKTPQEILRQTERWQEQYREALAESDITARERIRRDDGTIMTGNINEPNEAIPDGGAGAVRGAVGEASRLLPQALETELPIDPVRRHHMMVRWMDRAPEAVLAQFVFGQRVDGQLDERPNDGAARTQENGGLLRNPMRPLDERPNDDATTMQENGSLLMNPMRQPPATANTPAERRRQPVRRGWPEDWVNSNRLPDVTQAMSSRHRVGERLRDLPARARIERSEEPREQGGQGGERSGRGRRRRG